MVVRWASISAPPSLLRSISLLFQIVFSVVKSEMVCGFVSGKSCHLCFLCQSCVLVQGRCASGCTVFYVLSGVMFGSYRSAPMLFCYLCFICVLLFLYCVFCIVLHLCYFCYLWRKRMKGAFRVVMKQNRKLKVIWKLHLCPSVLIFPKKQKYGCFVQLKRCWLLK